MSCTRTPRSHRGHRVPAQAYVAAVGIVWSWAALAVTSLVMPGYLALGVRTIDSGWYRALAGSGLLPVTLARVLLGEGLGGARTAVGTLTPLGAAASALAGCGMTMVAWAIFHVPGARRWVAAVVVALACTVAVSSTGFAAHVRHLVAADRAYVESRRFASVDWRHPDSRAVALATCFVAEHSDSCWVTEALRVLALDATARGRYREAATLWTRFATAFREPGLPGEAYGVYSAATCEERLGNVMRARRLYGRSLEIIRRRGGDLQGWIAASAAERIAHIDVSRSMVASSRYWLTKASSLEELYGMND